MVKFNVGNAIQGAAGGFSAGGPLGAIAGGALGGFFGGGGSSGNSAKKAFEYWKKQFDIQSNFEKWKMSNAHQLEADDLSKAGINPSVTGKGQGAMNATAPGGGLSEGIIGNTGETNRINSALRATEIFNQMRKTKAEIDNIQQDSIGKSLNNKLVQQYGSEEKKRQIAQTIQETELAKANSGLANARTNEAIINTMLTKAGIPAQQAVGDFYKNHPTIGAIITGMREAMPIFSTIMGGAGMITSAKKFGQMQNAIQHRWEVDRRDKLNHWTNEKRLSTQKIKYDRRGRATGSEVSMYNYYD